VRMVSTGPKRSEIITDRPTAPQPA
jgi:hypothetical protein